MNKFFSTIKRSIDKSRTGKVSAIILCAGESTRFGNGKNKQQELIFDKTVSQLTIEAFQFCDFIDEIVLVVKKEEIENYKQLVYNFGYSKVKSIVTGGNTRTASAFRGYRHISAKSSYVCIHDGARCLVTSEIIESVLKNAKQYKVASASSHITDTVKMTDKDGFVKKTLNRDLICTVQTPQIFERNVYEICYQKAKQKGFYATDDCMLAEIEGFSVKLVDTGWENIKITYEDDIKKAEFILKNRGITE